MIRPRDPGDPRVKGETFLQSQRHPVRLPASTAMMLLFLGILVATLGDGVARWIGVGLLAVGVLLSAWQYMRRDDRT